MAHKVVQHPRWSAAVNATYTGPPGEIVIITDDWSIRVHDGVTPGGKLVDQANVVLDPSTNEQVISHIAAWESDPSTGTAELIARKPVDIRQDIGAQLTAAPTIQTLRLLSTNLPVRHHERIVTSGYYAPGDRGGNAFYADTSDTTTPDNGGNVIVDLAGRRWKQIDTALMDVRQWGAKGDSSTAGGGTNDYAVLQACADACRASGATMHFSAGTYMCRGTLNIRCNCSTSAKAVLQTDEHRILVVLGAPDGSADKERDAYLVMGLPFLHRVGPISHDNPSTACWFGKMAYCTVRFIGTDVFHTGVWLNGQNTAFTSTPYDVGVTWIQVFLGVHAKHKIALRIEPQLFGTVNQCIFYGGELNCLMNQTMTATERSPGYYGCYVGISPPNFSVISNNTFINTSIEGAGWEYAINCLGCFNRWVNVRFERGGNQPTLPTQNVHVRFFGRDDVDPTTENILEAGLRQPDPLTVIEDANGTGLTGPSCCNNRVNRRQYAPYRFSNNQGSYATLQLQNKSAMNPPYLIMGYPAASDMDTQGTPPLGFGLAPTMLGFRQPADTDWRSYLDNSQIAFGPGTAALDTRMARDAGAGRFRFYGAPSPQDHAIGLSNNPNPSYPFYYSVVSGALNRYIYLVNATTTGAAEIGYIIACGTSAEKGAYGSFVGCNNLHANASLRGKIVLRNTDPGAQGVVLGVPYAGQSVEFQTNNFTQTVVAVDQQTTAGGIFETALLLRADGGIRRVLIGPADSGGTGFRALRVNSLYAPTGVVATPGVTQVALTWNAPSGALTYTVLQATALGGPYTTVEAGIAVNNKTVTGLTTGTPYYFKVSAQNASGTSDNSVVVTATPT